MLFKKLKEKFIESLKVLKVSILCKEFLINTIGTCLGALFALLIAYHVYERQSEFKATVNLEMVQQEMTINRVLFDLIEQRLDEWLRDETNPYGPLFIEWRLNTNSLLIASRSENVYYNTSPHIVAGIYGHLTSLQSLNSELDSFNNLILGSIGNPNINTQLFISWVKALRTRIHKNSAESDKIYGYLSKYLKADTQQKRIRISKHKTIDSNKN